MMTPEKYHQQYNNGGHHPRGSHTHRMLGHYGRMQVPVYPHANYHGGFQPIYKYPTAPVQSPIDINARFQTPPADTLRRPSPVRKHERYRYNPSPQHQRYPTPPRRSVDGGFHVPTGYSPAPSVPPNTMPSSGAAHPLYQSMLANKRLAQNRKTQLQKETIKEEIIKQSKDGIEINFNTSTPSPKKEQKKDENKQIQIKVPRKKDKANSNLKDKKHKHSPKCKRRRNEHKKVKHSHDDEREPRFNARGTFLQRGDPQRARYNQHNPHETMHGHGHDHDYNKYNSVLHVDSDSDSSDTDSRGDELNYDHDHFENDEESRYGTKGASGHTGRRYRPRSRYSTYYHHDAIEVGYNEEPWYVQANEMIQESCPALNCDTGSGSDSDSDNYLHRKRGRPSPRHGRRRHVMNMIAPPRPGNNVMSPCCLVGTGALIGWCLVA